LLTVQIHSSNSRQYELYGFYTIRRQKHSRNVGLDGESTLCVSVCQSLGVNGKVDGGHGWSSLVRKEVVNERRVRVDLGRGRVPAATISIASTKIVGADSPSDNNFLASTVSCNPTHQLSHVLVVIHIHSDLALRLGMRKGETRPNLELCYSTCRSRYRGVGMSYTKEGTDHTRRVRFSCRTTSMVVKDLSENGRVDSDSCRGSTGYCRR
jgi:hypothetical protein